MSRKLDNELAQAILPGDDEVPALEKPAVARREPVDHAPRNMGLLVVLLVMVGSVVTLFLVGFKEAAVYATPIDTLVAANGKGELVGRKVRVEGELVPGTLEKRDQPCEYRFNVHGKDTKQILSVRYAQCVIPDTFRDVPQGGVQVTVEGALSKEGGFEASLVMAKCASKYDPKTHSMDEGAKTAPTGMPID
ncbi:MAG: cytochrome c maturation protein CcmE [Byssovorax sp.]